MIEIIPYNLRWPQDFERLATRIRRALGSRAVRVDHIGSTAVPGLSAKDIVDIQVTVRELSADVAEGLQSAGFLQRGGVRADHVPPGEPTDPAHWAKLLFVEPAGERRANVHVRVAGSRNQRYALLFRDYLRANTAMAAAYAELKRRLAASLANPKDYPEVKDPAVDLIYLAAQAWAEICGWQSGDSERVSESDAAGEATARADFALSFHEIALTGDSLAAGVRVSSEVAEIVSATRQLYLRRGFVRPWIGYLAVADGRCIGTCGYTGPPADGAVEIAYFTFPAFEGLGFATAMAKQLLAIALRDSAAGLQVIAHTLPQQSPSTSILRKIGFRLHGAIEHPEDGLVWKWSV